jgi:hypothetical protein
MGQSSEPEIFKRPQVARFPSYGGLGPTLERINTNGSFDPPTSKKTVEGSLDIHHVYHQLRPI